MIIAIIVLAIVWLLLVIATAILFYKLKLAKVELWLLSKYCYKKWWNERDRIEAIDYVIEENYHNIPDDAIDVRKIKLKTILK